MPAAATCTVCKHLYPRLSGMWCGPCQRFVPALMAGGHYSPELDCVALCVECLESRWALGLDPDGVCSACVRERRRIQLEAAHNRRKCRACKQPFKAWRKRVRYCGEDCQAASSGRRRSARLRTAKRRGSHTQQEWRSLLAAYDWRCAWCRVRRATARDHIVAIARGGSDDIRNILPACTGCNSSKNDAPLSEWIAGRGSLRVSRLALTA